MADEQSTPPTYSGLNKAAGLLMFIGFLESIVGGILLAVGVIAATKSEPEWYAPMCIVGGASGIISGILLLALGYAAEALRDIAINSWRQTYGVK